jgi:hypothetical protein
MTTVRLAQQKLTLSLADVLGSGGEATVFALDPQRVAKVYHQATPAHGKKLEALLQLGKVFPTCVAAPTDLLLNAKGSAVVGCVLPRIAKEFEPLATLFRSKLRGQATHSQREVVNVLLQLATTLGDLHGQGIVVGDLNDQNELWFHHEVAFIDVDSFQIPGFPCAVATEAYLSPQLYGVDLGKRACFLPHHDNYSWSVLAMRALLCIHPYGGIHPTLKGIPARAQAKQWVLSPEVRYPDKIALPKETLSDELLVYFQDIFAGGHDARQLPLQLLIDYAKSLEVCTLCGFAAPKTRSACPKCASLKPKPTSRTSVTKIRVEKRLETDGPILAIHVQGEHIHALAHEKGLLVRYWLNNHSTFRQELQPYQSDWQSVSLSPNEIAIALGENVCIYQANTAVAVAETTTKSFSRRPVLASIGSDLLRIAGGYIMRGKRSRGHWLEKPAINALDNQTFLSSYDARSDLVLGAHRMFHHHQFFQIAEGKHLDLPLPNLEPDESLLTFDMQSDGHAILVLRHTQQKGIRYLRVDLVDKKNSLACSSKVRSDMCSTRAFATGKVFQGTVVLHPTNDGIVQEHLSYGQVGTLKTMPGTEMWVHEESILKLHPQGLLSVTNNQLFLLSQ